MLSSIAVGKDFDPYGHTVTQEDDLDDYGMNRPKYELGKMQAEAYAFQNKKDTIAVRVPAVIDIDVHTHDILFADRLFWYAERICNKLPVCAKNLDAPLEMVTTHEEANFLCFLAESSFRGAIGFRSDGVILIKDLISLYEGYSDTKTVFSSDKKHLHPFHWADKTPVVNIADVNELGYPPKQLNEWLDPLVMKLISAVKKYDISEVKRTGGMDVYTMKLLDEQRMAILRLNDELNDLTETNLKNKLLFDEHKAQNSIMMKEFQAKNEVLINHNDALLEHNAQLEQALSVINTELQAKLEIEHNEVLKLGELLRIEHEAVLELRQLLGFDGKKVGLFRRIYRAMRVRA
jgi:hypothetical protein